MRLSGVLAIFLLIWSVAGVSAAQACAVCFGDPQSPMARGAVMGVVTLVGIVGFVLAAIAGTGFFWLHRSLKLSRASAALPDGDAASPP